LRNYIAQNAIDVAEKGDYSEVRRVLRLLENPYSDTIDFGDLDISGKQQTVQDEDAGMVWLTLYVLKWSLQVTQVCDLMNKKNGI